MQSFSKGRVCSINYFIDDRAIDTLFVIEIFRYIPGFYGMYDKYLEYRGYFKNIQSVDEIAA